MATLVKKTMVRIGADFLCVIRNQKVTMCFDGLPKPQTAG